MLTFLLNLFGSKETTDTNVLGGADEAFTAIMENFDGEKRYVAKLGEPELVDRGGQFSTDLMVRIPTFTTKGDPNPPNIEYDLPDAEIGETTSELFELLDYYDIDQVSSLGDLKGNTVAATFEDGTLSLLFDEVAE